MSILFLKQSSFAREGFQIKKPCVGKKPLKRDQSSMQSLPAKHVVMELLIAVSETVPVSVFRVSMQTFLPFVYTCTVPQTDAVSGKLNCIPSSESSCCKFPSDMVAVEFHKVPHHFTNTLRIHRLLFRSNVPLFPLLTSSIT